MTTKHLAVGALVCVGSALGLGLCTQDVHAQDSIATKKDGELGNKEFDKNQLPSKLEASLGIGSIFVMIAVVKYV